MWPSTSVMRSRAFVWPLFLLAAFCSMECAQSRRESSIAPAELARVGQSLYSSLKRSDGSEVEAFLEPAHVPLGASAACINCHGAAGEGSLEGAIAAPPLGNGALGIERHLGGAGDRPSYNAKLFHRALTTGINPAGRMLHAAMPRFRVTEVESQALFEWLRLPVAPKQAGLSATAIHLGVALPLSGSLALAGSASRQLLTHYFSILNSNGGVWQRQVVLHFEDSASDTTTAVKKLLAQGVVALIAGSCEQCDESKLNLEQAGAVWIGALHASDQVSATSAVYSLFPSRSVLNAASTRTAQMSHVEKARAGSQPTASTIAVPNWIDESTTPQFHRYLDFSKTAGVDNVTSALVLGAFASARITEEVLRRAGAQPTLLRLRASLETVTDFDTFVTPPVSFGTRRRVGSSGFFYAQRVDGQLLRTSGFISMSPLPEVDLLTGSP
jgi:cytochrome c553